MHESCGIVFNKKFSGLRKNIEEVRYGAEAAIPREAQPLCGPASAPLVLSDTCIWVLQSCRNVVDKMYGIFSLAETFAVHEAVLFVQSRILAEDNT